jgi:hypothetical protein
MTFLYISCRGVSQAGCTTGSTADDRPDLKDYHQIILTAMREAMPPGQ